MRTITATIEKASDGGYGIYTDILGLIGSGQKKKQEPTSVKYSKNKPHTIMSAPVNIPPGTRKATPSLMRKYKSDLVKASAKQKDQIQAKYSEMIQNLERVKF